MPTSITYEKRKTRYAWSQFYIKCSEIDYLWGVIDTLNLSEKQELRFWLELSPVQDTAIIWACKIWKRHRLRTLFSAWKKSK